MSAPVFTADWSNVRGYWGEMLAPLAGRPGLRFLEVGAFEGQATLWLLENILTDPDSSIEVVDTFEGSPEHAEMGIDTSDLYGTFARNVAAHRAKVTTNVGPSAEVLRALYLRDTLPFRPRYDFVYLDGSHRAADVLEDAVLAWPMVRPGGLMVFDDYEWNQFRSDSPMHPKPGVDAFLRANAFGYSEVYRGYQLAVRKSS